MFRAPPCRSGCRDHLWRTCASTREACEDEHGNEGHEMIYMDRHRLHIKILFIWTGIACT